MFSGKATTEGAGTAVRGVETVEHEWIPMPDGTRLSARIWRPDSGGPFPAVFEYIPYRKRDMVRLRDERNHPFLARHGYACLRVDMRGSGDSEGSMPDMYTRDELGDARHVIDWIAAQPWCDGAVGMFGTSWGGTASLQAAVNAPAALKAVLANCATVDRYEDDIHWMGGCMLTDSIEWGATLPSILAAPPDAGTTGGDWLSIWTERLANTAFPFEHWARNSLRGSYWRHGSVAFQADHLDRPILMIGGWADRYSNNVMRLVLARPDICRGIIGPWGHHYPDRGEPGPAMDFQRVSLGWWDRWLKPEEDAGPDARSEATGLTLWRRQFDPPGDRLATRSGQWLSVGSLEGAAQAFLHLAEGALLASPADATATLKVPFDLRHGECAGDTGYFGRVGGLPLDQSADDARALVFDSAVLTEDIDLIGHATLDIAVGVERMPAQLACRICEVSRDGVSNLVTRTVLALELDETLDEVVPCPPDGMRRYRVTFPSTAYRFAAGNRVRLALASSYWPLAWPVSSKTSPKVSTGGAVLGLPQPPPGTREVGAPFGGPSDHSGDTVCRSVSDGPLERSPPAETGGVVAQGWHQPESTTEFTDLGLRFGVETSARYESDGEDPSTVRCSVTNRYRIERPDGDAVVESRLVVQAEPGGYSSTASLSAWWNGETMLDRGHSFKERERGAVQSPRKGGRP